MTEMSKEDPRVDLAFETAELGDFLQDWDDRPIPDGWVVMDGSTLISYEWPDFVKAQSIRGPRFTLPSPQRAFDGQRWLIKLGERRKIPIANSAATPFPPGLSPHDVIARLTSQES